MQVVPRIPAHSLQLQYTGSESMAATGRQAQAFSSESRCRNHQLAMSALDNLGLAISLQVQLDLRRFMKALVPAVEASCQGYLIVDDLAFGRSLTLMLGLLGAC